MQPAELLELRDDLEREGLRLQRLVEGLLALQPRLSTSGEAVAAAALRLHSFYTGVERCLLLVSRVVNGGTPTKGEGWHRRLLERMALATATRPALLREGPSSSCRSTSAFAIWCATSMPMSCGLSPLPC